MLRYAITEGLAHSPLSQDAAERLVEQCGAVAQAGAAFLLIREKAPAAGELAAVSRRVMAAVRAISGGTRVLVAGRVDVAFAAGADGVHLSGARGELRVGQVRRLMPEAWVSVSCHALEEVARAREEEASAVLFSPVFGKSVGGVEVVGGVGLERLRAACGVAGRMPVFALGGVTEGNAGECLAAGAAGVAGIRMFFGR